MLSVRLLSAPRLEAIWSIGDAMYGDGVEQVLIETLAKCGVVLTLNGDHRLKGLERLDRSFEANRSRLDALLGRCLRHNRPNEVMVGPFASLALIRSITDRLRQSGKQLALLAARLPHDVVGRAALSSRRASVAPTNGVGQP
jgi:hypothetical protein